jgi:hypothetical protein
MPLSYPLNQAQSHVDAENISTKINGLKDYGEIIKSAH